MDQSLEQSQYHEVDGIYISKSYSVECLRSALRYKAQPGDLFIVTYPKCGTTWTQHIVYNIINNRPPLRDQLLSWIEMPFLEAQGAESIDDMKRPGPIKSHLPFRLETFSQEAKYIYVARNPYDCCVSFFYHTRGMPEYKFQNGTFSEFVDMFLQGKVDYGDYFNHLFSWYEHRNDPNVLFVTYEQLKEDTTAWVLQIADFIGEDYGRNLQRDTSRLETILKNVSFGNVKDIVNESMKNVFKNFETKLGGKTPRWLWLMMESMGPEATRKPLVGDIVRKGIIGDWRNHFSGDQVNRFKKWIEEKTRGSNVMELWNDRHIPL